MELILTVGAIPLVARIWNDVVAQTWVKIKEETSYYGVSSDDRHDDGQYVARRYVRICTTRFCYDAIPHIRRQTFNIGINYVIIGDIIWQ